MRIPTLLKIEKQAKAYSYLIPNLSLTEEEQKEYDLIEKQRQKLHRKIENLRKGCVGGSECTCGKNPELQKLVPECNLLVDRVNYLYNKGLLPRRNEYIRQLKLLEKKRELKIELKRKKSQKVVDKEM
jgi:hypothetical protein